ncbi:MAG: hydrogenase maturation protease [Methylococcaceae bacterium]
MVKPVLLFGYGNLSRGDDALGPLLLEYVESHFDLDGIEILSDFQLQIEHALDLENRSLILFVDASVSCTSAFDFAVLTPARDKSYTTHAMSPAAVLDVYQSIKKQTPPPCFLLSIKGEKFELGEGLSANAEQHLAQACQFSSQLLGHPDSAVWRQHATGRSW